MAATALQHRPIFVELPEELLTPKPKGGQRMPYDVDFAQVLSESGSGDRRSGTGAVNTTEISAAAAANPQSPSAGLALSLPAAQQVAAKCSAKFKVGDRCDLDIPGANVEDQKLQTIEFSHGGG